MTPAPPSPPTADWNSDDASNLKNFLASKTGERLLVHLGESVPELLSSGEINAILIRSGEVKGGSTLLAQLVSLTVETPESLTPVKSAFPDLDDESAWNPDNTPK